MEWDSIRHSLANLFKRREQQQQLNGFDRDIICRLLFENAIATYQDLMNLSGIKELEEIDGVTGIYNHLLVHQAAYDIRQKDGYIVPVMIAGGNEQPFVATVVADIYPDSSMSVPARQAIMLQFNADAESPGLGIQGLTQTDANTLIWGLIDAGRFRQMMDSDHGSNYLTRTEYIDMLSRYPN